MLVAPIRDSLLNDGWTLNRSTAPPLGSLKELHAQLFFQLPYLLAQWRLGHVQAQCGAAEGQLFSHSHQVSHLNSNCTLSALAVKNADGTAGPIVLQNPKPGTRGSLGRGVLELPGTYRLDPSLSKNFRISESKSVQIRVDATNVLNHPDSLSPTLTLSDSFGDITGRGNQVRNFQGQFRFNF